MKLLKYIVLLITLPLSLFAEPLYSPAWGFALDLPEDYEYAGGDLKDRFTFRTGDGAAFDLVVYPGTYQSVEELVNDASRRIGNRGKLSFFDYRTRKAALMELKFSEGGAAREGWGLCVELEPAPGAKSGSKKPLLLALAYGPAGKADLEVLHLSSLDSIAPSAAEQHYCGPVTEFYWPRGEQKRVPLAGAPGVEALIAENDAEAAQALVDREYTLLRRYERSPLWKEAWIRFYRAIYRDSWERIANACFQLERNWAVRALHEGTTLSGGEPRTSSSAASPGGEPRTSSSAANPEADLAAKALDFVQGFSYERNLTGSDFVNLVSAVTEGRGDCDSRAMLWAILLTQADIPSCIMVSKDFSHAMGLTDIPGTGARFQLESARWLVAETTVPVAIGRIRADISGIDHWLGVTFE